MLLFPKKYSERARLINDRLVRLISILENYPAYKPLIDSLLKERSDEFDVGQGIAGVTVAEARIESGMLSYEDLSRLSLRPAQANDHFQIERTLSYFTKALLTPAEAVLQYVGHITGLGFDLIANQSGLARTQMLNDGVGPRTGYGGTNNEKSAVELSHSQRKKLYQILQQSTQIYKSDDIQFPPREDLISLPELYRALGRRMKGKSRAISFSL